MPGPPTRDQGGSDRGQAFTLEALVAALLLVTAVLFALQAVVITPTSAGTLDRDTQAELHQESVDSLVTAANDGELSMMARYWDPANGTFAGDPDGPAGSYVSEDIGYQRDVLPIQDVGESLNHSVREGNQYNVILAYQTEDGDRETTRLVYQGTPGHDVVTASYTITLTDDQLVTGPNEGDTRLADVPDDDAAIPNIDDASPVYNVVEVRLVLW